MKEEQEVKSVEQAKIDTDFGKRALRATLAALPEVRFLNSIWAARGVQSDYSEKAVKFLKQIPQEAIDAGIPSKHAIYPWELELLVNERLALEFSVLFQFLTPEIWPQITALVNLVRNIENDESVIYHKAEDIIDHLFSIGGRQFDWQQGFLTKQEIFRSVYVYGQAECADYFEAENGVDINAFTSTCFGFFAMFMSHPQARADVDLSQIDVTPTQRDRVLRIVSQHLRDAKASARTLRDANGEMAYQPSILRTRPIIAVSAACSQLVCPLPDLLMNRMTFGLFYDVIGGGGPVRQGIGRRFEEYTALNLSHFIPQMTIETEFPYKTKNGDVMSPDILISSQDGELQALLECKASRLPLKARYALFDVNERGYRDMVKGVKQIWRFMADLRTGRVQRNVSGNIVGALVTLDSWFVAAPQRQESIIQTAKDEITSQPGLSEDDMIPISFVYMPEFERTLAYGDHDLILKTLRSTAQKAKRGYSFDIAPEKEDLEGKEYQKFPFDDKLSKLLPWWGKFNRL